VASEPPGVPRIVADGEDFVGVRDPNYRWRLRQS